MTVTIRPQRIVGSRLLQWLSPLTARPAPVPFGSRFRSVVRASAKSDEGSGSCLTDFPAEGSNNRKMAMLFKLETENDRGIWSDVRGADGKVLVFDDEKAARAKLAELFPVMVQMEKYAGGKHTRVVRVFQTDEEWAEGTPPKP
jgi:hypothetical protein